MAEYQGHRGLARDCLEFPRKLEGLLPGSEARLPTEAEWEYACRAGTQTPFSFGANITPEQVNYNGNSPYAGADKGQYRQETVAVRSLPANAWGLYEMHGNVWEWCAAAPGSTTPGSRARPTAARTSPATATTTRAFVLP